MTDEPRSGVAQDASTIDDVVGAFEREGYRGQFVARPDAQIECLACKQGTPAQDADVRGLRRLEGASDPDDMLAVVALVCRRCGSGGTLLLTYGPSASVEDAEVLRRLEKAPPPPP